MKLLGILALAGLGFYSTASAIVPCDATTGASVKVRAITTTLTSAVISYTEGHSNGKRYIQYGIGTLGPINPVQIRKNAVHPESLKALTPNSKYIFRFSAFWGKPDKSIVTGSFITDGSSCGELIPTTGRVEGYVLNKLGDTLQNVPVTIDSAGKKIAIDTTDDKGYYAFELKPGSVYKLSTTYPPYTSPAIANVPSVAIGKSVKIPNQVLTGAFQLSGMVRLATGGDGVDNATVTITNKTDVTKSLTLFTDETGQFELGILAGEYSVMAVAGGKSLPSPLSIPITTKSVKVPDLILSGTTSIKISPNHGKISGSTKVGYDANGARQLDKPARQVQVIRFTK